MVLRSYGVGPAGVGWYVAMVPLSYFAGNYGASVLVRRLGRPAADVGSARRPRVRSGPLVIALYLMGARSPFAFSLPLLLLGPGTAC